MSRKVFTAGEVLAAADVNNFLMDQSVMSFATSAARTTAIPSPVEGMVTWIENTNNLEVYTGTVWQTFYGTGYQYVDTIYYNSSSTFTKATYPYLRAVKVTLVGGGGGSAGCAATTTNVKIGRAGSGSASAESFILASALSASVTVTVGAGGTGGAAGDNDGNDGGRSSFGLGTAFEVSANGGVGGQTATAGTYPQTISSMGNQTTGVGDLVRVSGYGTSALLWSGTVGLTGMGGYNALFPAPSPETRSSGNGAAADLYGNGAQGSLALNSSVARSGGAGSRGIVIVDLYA
jgi:hypothetical protein